MINFCYNIYYILFNLRLSHLLERCDVKGKPRESTVMSAQQLDFKELYRELGEENGKAPGHCNKCSATMEFHGKEMKCRQGATISAQQLASKS